MGKNHLGAPCPVDRDLRQRFLAGSKALGCDPANTPNGDRFALSRWQGAVMLEITKLACQDATEFGEEIAAIAATDRIAPQNIGVDGVGVSAATVNHLRRALPSGMRLRVLLGGSEDSREGLERSDEITKDARSGFQLTANRFFNLRAQMAWELAQKLRRGTVALPKNAQLWRELLAIRYSTENGRSSWRKRARSQNDSDAHPTSRTPRSTATTSGTRCPWSSSPRRTRLTDRTGHLAACSTPQAARPSECRQRRSWSASFTTKRRSTFAGRDSPTRGGANRKQGAPQVRQVIEKSMSARANAPQPPY